MTREELERIVIHYMDSFTTMTLACCTEERPWAADVFYVRQGFDLIFFSSPSSRHSLVFSATPLLPPQSTAITEDGKKLKDSKWRAELNV